MDILQFRTLIADKGRELYRPMPWRENASPYFVLVSELMLQQTQVDRVVPKFNDFVETFPDFSILASASLDEVLRQWQGLGYNRRAKYVHQTAKQVVSEFNSALPDSVEVLSSLPGIGPNTAAAIRVYAFNLPAIFIETNIRTIFIHHFFTDSSSVDDKQIKILLEQALDQQNPRHFYWALMDYGTFLKRQGVRNLAQSKHYTKQSKLTGSLREMRGLILKALVKNQSSNKVRELYGHDPRFEEALTGLAQDGLIIQKRDHIHLPRNEQ